MKSKMHAFTYNTFTLLMNIKTIAPIKYKETIFVLNISVYDIH